ncbi:hypothetical protein RSAG8_12640, partial [Rhizoctonia solani AG-8 WAC10335]
MPKRGRASQVNSEHVDYTITFYDDALASTAAPPPSPTVGIQWFGEPVQATSPSIPHRPLGKRRRTAPKTTTIHIEPSKPVTNPSAAARAKIDQPNLGPHNDIPVDEDEWEDVHEPIAPPPDEFVTQSNDARPKKNPNYYLRQWLRSSCDSYVRLTYEHDGPPSAKKVDSGDISLSDGQGYSPPKQPYKEWTKLDHGQQRDEKPSCDHHKAGNDVSVKFSGRDVTGIGAITCSSHSCYIPRGMVDFFQGELFIYADYGFASGLRYMTQGGRLAITMTYDIMCHWLCKFRERVKKLPPEIAIPPDLDFVGAIPKWHLVGHIPECYVRYSLDHTQHVGRIDGEGVERVWAHQNEHSGSTSEQGPGMRTDSMTNVAEQWNFEIMCRLQKTLPERYKKARPEYLNQKRVHEELTAEFPKEKIAAWEVESLEPVKDSSGKWVSPLMDPIFVNGKFHSTVRAERDQESPTARKTSRRPGVTRWISAGIELEHSMQVYSVRYMRLFNTTDASYRKKIQEKEKALGKNPTMQQTNGLNTQRLAARDRISAHDKKRLTYTGETDTPDHPEFSPIVDDAMDGAIVIMPSSYSPEILTSAETIRQMLGAKAFTLKYKNHARGQGATTRAQASIKEQTEKLQQAKWRYTNSRDALLRLGLLCAEDKDKYLELTDKDLKTLKSYIEETSRGLGQGHAAISWIWRTSVVKNTAEWEISILRTEWFRSRERYKRWEEQLILLKREMVMGIRSFLKHREIWTWKAVQPNTTPGMQAYALARAEWFKDLAISMYGSCRKSLEDDTVRLEWSSEWLRKNVNGKLYSIITFSFMSHN